MKKMFAFSTALMLGLTCLPYLSEAKESKHTDSSVTTLSSMSTPTSLNQSLNQEKQQFKTSAANFNVNLDLLGIGRTMGGPIMDAIVRSSNRGGFVKSCMETAFYSSGQRYNVMVFNLSQSYHNDLRGVKFFGTANYHGVFYGIWVFESGQFTNQGDGGWINWAMKGWFDRNGKTVTFRKP
ncbi:stress response protein YvgO [Bacillus paralicheniformis]|uniref:stress response protein YvgO n=1 Tax=Bacillus paralicheniformis TaxID=1648923 RepID=UPI00128D2606|nr:stress response protein YvgO [Bacillus paralicheniformis]MPQ25037.1 stress response protein YvgO [Bacillus paralicheniformis]